jgi:hypothetical protein
MTHVGMCDKVHASGRDDGDAKKGCGKAGNIFLSIIPYLFN